ncbi:Thioredoxin-dependent 5'-adenylylsulfate reductase [Polaromonas vacuolata]|uniref:Adenosine 5'-phosphosulfate reductase n=1 Tax=Polaromonas vacuolata TaxID=37448 RepID=A0A6H2HAK2_9BURK|nr:phosphoadenylyl-sulfate reductase [Polaromonas vacuolata]QJC56506.1 Thioredoxin-dependent 5'-adenylylsulfate reductase [Polaromonas vacuolata]
MNAIELYAKPSANFAEKLKASQDLLRLAAKDHSPLTQASSLGAEDMVITHLISQTSIASSIFVLDTGMLHTETLDLIGRIEARYARKVDSYKPDAEVAEQFIADNGKDAMYKSLALRKACCGFRKMVPLDLALAGKNGWITGLRREQSDARAEVHDLEMQDINVDGKATQRAKVNPLADWTWGDIWYFISEEKIPYNPLHDEFFPSIGCAPCTRAVTLGEDFRSGRWWWEQESAKECGLHVDGAHDESLVSELPTSSPLSSPMSSPLSPSSRLSSIPIKEIP